jgi:hypothetical protein
MKHNKTGKKKKVGTEKIAKESGFMYYIGRKPAMGRQRGKTGTDNFRLLEKGLRRLVRECAQVYHAFVTATRTLLRCVTPK